MKKAIRIFDVLLAAVLVPVMVLLAVGSAVLPSSYVRYDKRSFTVQNVFSCISDGVVQNVDYQSAASVGATNATVKLFGLFPVDDVEVSDAPRQKVYVSGESFGVKLYTDGVIVVGTKPVEIDGEEIDPASECGLQTGDVIVSINGVNVYTADAVEDALNDNTGGPYAICYKRDGRVHKTTLQPVYSQAEGSFKAGMWVRDSTAGIGTITFYNPENSTFAALGHPINDVDTNEIMPLLEGEAVEASVTKVYKGTPEQTGSLSCSFGTRSIGTLTKNTLSGVYGTYNGSAKIDDGRYYEVASAQEVEKGFAQVLTTVDGGGPQLYSIEITKINYNDTKEQKSMVIRVTDEELIEKTGGIVQGMSGSPIIQNGRLVGAVTHVVVNDPEKGYAIFAQNMLAESQT